MTLVLLGANHRTAPIELRERLYVPPGELGGVLGRLVGEAGVREAVLLSTCNRTEVYLEGAGRLDEEEVVRILAGRAGLEPERTASLLYREREHQVAPHLFRVAAGLDSLIVGEPQIQGQVGSAYETAREARPEAVGPVLHRLFQAALSTGGEVRARTDVGRGAGSVPSAAVALAEKILGELEGRRAAVLGAGEMGRSTLEAFRHRGVEGALVASRTVERAAAAARETGALPVAYREIWHRLPELDILVTSTAAPHPLVTLEGLRRVRGARERSLVIIDIAVPRDVEAGVADLPGVFLYNIDDLQRIVETTQRERAREGEVATGLVETAADRFWSWYRARQVVPVIRAVRERAEAIRSRELEEALSGIEGLSEAELGRLRRATRLIVAKVLHGPTVALRRAAGERDPGEADALLELAGRLFGVEGQGRSGDGQGEGAREG